jgi:hypothetical protein
MRLSLPDVHVLVVGLEEVKCKQQSAAYLYDQV